MALRTAMLQKSALGCRGTIFMSETSVTLLLVAGWKTLEMGVDDALRKSGFSVLVAANACEAMEILEQGLPDLVIADEHPAGMSAVQLATRLRLTSGAPFLLLTDSVGLEREQEKLALGIDACIPVSTDISLLKLRIDALLRETVEARDILRSRVFRRPVVTVLTGSKAEHSDISVFVETLRNAGEIVDLKPIEKLSEATIMTSDCIVIDLTDMAVSGVEICRHLDKLRRGGGERQSVSSVRLMAIVPEGEVYGAGDVQLYAAGVDECLKVGVDPHLFCSRLQALLRRKIVLDEIQLVDSERLACETALENVRAKAALAEALEAANGDLADVNKKLIDAQSQLVQSAKMASLGELVAGIAHEFNNPLAFVVAHGDTISRCLLGALDSLEQGEKDEAFSLLRKAVDRQNSSAVGLERMRDLVNSLRSFSRLDEGRFEYLDVPDAIRTVLALLGPKLDLGIEVVCDFQAPQHLRCQVGLIHQVLMNIISNAADALLAPARVGMHAKSWPEQVSIGGGSAEGRQKAEGPRITVTTRVGQQVSGRDEEAYIFEVTDNGPGVPLIMRERVFEPFFTTKPVGSGTGLGLATAYGIVQAHRGAIRIGDAPGGGAQFTVTVPVSGDVAVSEPEYVTDV